MKIRRRSRLLIEPPSSATGDIAFNLIVFFLVCASVQPDSGRKQSIPSSEEIEQEQETENIEVRLQRSVVLINGDPVPADRFDTHLSSLLQGRTGDDRIVIVNSEKDVPYRTWIDLTSRIEDVGGVVTLQLEEERQVQIP